MQFALVNDIRTVPSVGLVGACPACGGAMIPKCGHQRVHHWAHRGEQQCDAWWERETPRHRDWKSQFPLHWQEVVRWDQFGEKHVADVHTERGLTIEFQHSRLRPDERAAREQFYGNMMWVVDGTRLKGDFPRFVSGARSFSAPSVKGTVLVKGLYVTPSPQRAFSVNWLNSTVPVLIDFANAIRPTEKEMWLTRMLWCLLPKRLSGQAVVLVLSKQAFVHWVQSKDHLTQIEEIYEIVDRSLLQ